MTTGEKLQKLRKDNKYTQEELADIFNVSRQSISKWESDGAFPETDKLIQLSKLYHCTLDYLFNEKAEFVSTKDPRECPIATNVKAFLITTFCVAVLTLLLFIAPWFEKTNYALYFSCSRFNIYQAFFCIQLNWNNAFALLSVIAAALVAIFDGFYLRKRNKGLLLGVKICNFILLCALIIVVSTAYIFKYYDVYLGIAIPSILILILVNAFQFFFKPFKSVDK